VNDDWSDRRSDRVERSAKGFPVDGTDSDVRANDSSRPSTSPNARIGAAKLRLVAEQLSERDRQILDDLARVRVLSGGQLERLRFGLVQEGARGRVRRRVLRRLGALHLITTLDRRIGGVRAGSAGLVYALTAAGHRLVSGLENRRQRNPLTPGPTFLAHALDVAEIYVALHEATQAAATTLSHFAVEAHAAWEAPDRFGQLRPLRPDALLALETAEYQDVWWVEVDRSTESLPRLRAKLATYRRLAESGRPGPFGVMPRVLVTVPDRDRLASVAKVMRQLDGPEGLLHVCLHAEACELLLRDLIEKPP